MTKAVSNCFTQVTEVKAAVDAAVHITNTSRTLFFIHDIHASIEHHFHKANSISGLGEGKWLPLRIQRPHVSEDNHLLLLFQKNEEELWPNVIPYKEIRRVWIVPSPVWIRRIIIM
ncbi:unnamed protein product [Boreogadus saida]